VGTLRGGIGGSANGFNTFASEGGDSKEGQLFG
jgi:hypothetical protein